MAKTRVAINLERLMRQRGFRQKNLAIKAGLNETAVRDILQGRSKDPQISTLRGLARVLQCSVEELYLSPASRKARYGLSDKTSGFLWPEGVGADAEDAAKGIAAVPELEIPTIAQPEVLSEKKREVRQTWLLPSDVLPSDRADALCIIEVKDDSMAPDFMPGDKVLIDTSDTTPSPPGTFLLWDGAGLILRQCELVPGSSPKKVTLRAFNKRYSSHEAALKGANLCARVVGKWQKV